MFPFALPYGRRKEATQIKHKEHILETQYTRNSVLTIECLCADCPCCHAERYVLLIARLNVVMLSVVAIDI